MSDEEYTQPYGPTDPAEESTGATAPSQPLLQADAAVSSDDSKKWPGWPGDCVFRLIVPVDKVGSIIGRKGELIKRMCEDTGARIRVLDAPSNAPDRVVLISGKEELESPLSPAMDAAIRVFKRVSGISETEDLSGVAATAFCSIKLLVASTQAICLIGKQGSMIKSMQESSEASIRVLPEGELPVFATTDERIVEMQGEALKVLKAVEAVLGHLRKFLVDHSVVPLFEKPVTNNTIVKKDSQSSGTWSDQSLLHSIQSSNSLSPNISGNRAASCSHNVASESSDQPMHDVSARTQPSTGTGNTKMKRKAASDLMLESVQKKLSSALADVSRAIVDSAKILANKVTPHPFVPSAILFKSLEDLELPDDYLLECYDLLSDNDALANMFIGTSLRLRSAMLKSIMNKGSIDK